MKIERIYYPEPPLPDRVGPERSKHKEGAALHTYRAVDLEQENRQRREQASHDHSSPDPGPEKAKDVSALTNGDETVPLAELPHHLDVVV